MSLADLTPQQVERLSKLKYEFPYFSNHVLRIRDKAGAIHPFRLNRAQLHIHNLLEKQRKETGRVRAIVVKARQIGCCYAPHMRVLTADYRWIPISEVRTGERLIGVDEEGVGESTRGTALHRKMCTAIVEAKVNLRREVFAVELDSGVTLEVTGGHRHMCKQRGGDRALWREVSKMRVGDHMRVAAHAPSKEALSFEDGWAAGILDGEGSFGVQPQVRLTMTQTAGPVLDRFRQYVTDLGVNFYELIDDRLPGETSKLGSKPVHRICIDCYPDIIKVLTRTRPSRFVARELFVGKKLPKTTPRFNAWARVLSIKSLGVRDVVDLQTSEKTFICEGIVSHNSTYIQGRFYWRLWGTQKSLRAFILTHEQQATDNLFGMASRYQSLHPEGMGKPPLRTGNAKEMVFAHNGCGYQVSTAGTKETGRSATFQLFHGSEIGFWPNAQSLAAGAFNTVGRAPGTEIILESTGNGVSGFFYKAAQAAIRGESEFQAIFIPWYWDDTLRVPCPETWQPSKVWTDYATSHKLEWDQLYWAFITNRESANAISATHDEPCWLFKQEFPATFDEAFQSSGNSFIPASDVLRARRPLDPVIGSGPIILGVDPARSGDKVGIIDRCGRRMGERICERMDPGGSVTYVASRIATIIDKLRPDMVNIDIGSNGAGVYDILMDQGYGYCVNAVNFGSNPISRGPTNEDVYFNRRAEMYDLMRQWFNQELPVQIPDDDGLQADLCSAQWGAGATRYNSSNELILEEKAAIKLRIGASPDLGDAAALTHAVPFAFTKISGQTKGAPKSRNKRTGYIGIDDGQIDWGRGKARNTWDAYRTHYAICAV